MMDEEDVKIAPDGEEVQIDDPIINRLRKNMLTLPRCLLATIMHYAASPQSAALCRDIVSYAFTMDRMFEYLMFGFLHECVNKGKWITENIHVMRLNGDRLLDCSPLVEFFSTTYMFEYLAFRCMQFDVPYCKDNFTPYDLSRRAPYYHYDDKDSRKLHMLGRRLKVFIGLLTADERKIFAKQYIFDKTHLRDI